MCIFWDRKVGDNGANWTDVNRCNNCSDDEIFRTMIKMFPFISTTCYRWNTSNRIFRTASIQSINKQTSPTHSRVHTHDFFSLCYKQITRFQLISLIIKSDSEWYAAAATAEAAAHKSAIDSVILCYIMTRQASRLAGRLLIALGWRIMMFSCKLCYVT